MLLLLLPLVLLLLLLVENLLGIPTIKNVKKNENLLIYNRQQGSQTRGQP
jgi:hypothetical protein